MRIAWVPSWLVRGLGAAPLGAMVTGAVCAVRTVTVSIIAASGRWSACACARAAKPAAPLGLKTGNRHLRCAGAWRRGTEGLARLLASWSVVLADAGGGGRGWPLVIGLGVRSASEVVRWRDKGSGAGTGRLGHDRVWADGAMTRR
jgi:hypothetical protein